MSKQIDAQRNWEKKNIRLYSFSCNKTYDADIIKFMEQKENKYGYLRSLVRRDMEKENKRPTGEWIPVSERLPEGKIDPMTNDFELVLCSTVWEVVRPYKFGKPIGHSKAHFWSGGGIMDDYVIAWKPMPESYKEEA